MTKRKVLNKKKSRPKKVKKISSKMKKSVKKKKTPKIRSSSTKTNELSLLNKEFKALRHVYSK
tara:strand:- start:230 stop:418 length:189 start_codon:yes stop_codon:yes gene_type:complete